MEWLLSAGKTTWYIAVFLQWDGFLGQFWFKNCPNTTITKMHHKNTKNKKQTSLCVLETVWHADKHCKLLNDSQKNICKTAPTTIHMSTQRGKHGMY